MFGWLWRRPLAMRVVVYTRADCPLCDEAERFLRRQQRRHRFALAFADIAGDPALTARYGEWIPVVEVDGRVRFRGAVNPVLWDRLIARASS